MKGFFTMQEQIKQIASRVKALREIYGLSAEELARELEVAPDAYSHYEQGRADIPISFLCKVGARFNVELGALLTGDNPRLHTFSVTRAGRGPSVERRRQYKYEELAANFVHKKAEPFLVTVDPRPEGEPVHQNAHPGQEFNYVLAGVLKVIVDKHEIVLQAGDALYFDSSRQHCMRAVGDRPARFLAVVI